MDLTRALPLVLTLGGAGLVAKGGGKMAERVIDTVKIVMTRSELSQIANLLETDSVLGNRLPRGNKAFSAWLREHMQARSGRDAALDLWQFPYEIARDGPTTLVRSLGPNQQRDSCAVARDEARDVESALDLQRAGDAAGTSAGKAVPDRDSATRAHDDVCVELHVVRAGKAGIDPILGADSPFRPVHARP